MKHILLAAILAVSSAHPALAQTQNGSVARLPFFFRNKNHGELWFEGTSLGRSDEKP